MMAFPVQLWAEDMESSAPSVASDAQGNSATEGIPVILEPVELKDGQTGYFVIAPYLESQEAAIVANFATNDPKHLILGVAGLDDPALKAALASGNLAWINSYIVADADQANAVKSAPVSLRQRIKDKIKSITDLAKREKTGLITALVVSGIVSGYVSIHSSSIPAGILALCALTTWGVFQAVFSHGWESYLDKGGALATKFLTWALGRDTKPGEQQFAETVGQFHATWLVNSVIEGSVLGVAGASAGLNPEGIMQAAWFGFLASTDLLDAAVAQKIKQGKLPIDFFKRFVVYRMIGAAIFQVAAYLQLSHVQFTVASALTFTLIYMALSRLMDPAIAKRTEALKAAGANASLRARANAGRVIYAAQTGKKTVCEYALTRRKPMNVASGEPAE
jgi:hypothetical protein